MHCVCCDRMLTDYEAVLRHPETNEFLDICLTCLKDIPIEPVVPNRLMDDTAYEIEDYE